MSQPTAPALAPATASLVEGGGWRVAGIPAGKPDPKPRSQEPPPSREPLAEFGRTLREEFGHAFSRFQRLQRDASDELLLFGLAHPELREEMLTMLEHDLQQEVSSVRLARKHVRRESEVVDA